MGEKGQLCKSTGFSRAGCHARDKDAGHEELHTITSNAEANASDRMHKPPSVRTGEEGKERIIKKRRQQYNLE
eukprot:6190936-Pleurochrysis_carterae.AAC.1